jgi:chitin synthase
MLVCAVLCAVKAVQNFDQPIFAKMIVSIASTYGVFIVSSLLALEPWSVYCPAVSAGRLIIFRHLLTCFIQYILFSPSTCIFALKWC